MSFPTSVRCRRYVVAVIAMTAEKFEQRWICSTLVGVQGRVGIPRVCLGGHTGYVVDMPGYVYSRYPGLRTLDIR